MHMKGRNPFDAVESQLLRPAADGIFIYFTSPASAWKKAGLQAGDIITDVVGKSVSSMTEFYKALKPASEEDKSRKIKVLSPNGQNRELEGPASARGFHGCVVVKGKPAWRQVADYDEEPDFSALKNGTEIMLRNSFGEETAGYESLKIHREGDLLDLEFDFRLGGGFSTNEQWDYFTRGSSTHLLDRHLTMVRTSFWEGRPGKDKLQGEMALASDGKWKGTQSKPEGGTENVEFSSNHLGVISGYSATLLVLTMPLRPGACLTFMTANDGRAYPICRNRFECVGKRIVKVDGKDIEAWCIAQRHYGNRADEDDEHYYVSSDRRLVRIEWGPDYGHCWAEEMSRDKTLATIPQHVRS